MQYKRQIDSFNLPLFCLFEQFFSNYQKKSVFLQFSQFIGQRYYFDNKAQINK